MVSRVAVAAASSRAKSPVGIERFVRRNDRAPVIVCCAPTDSGKAAKQTVKTAMTTVTRMGLLTRFLFLLRQCERLSRDRQRAGAVVAGRVRFNRVSDRPVVDASGSARNGDPTDV